jgi:broad specificity phosphatase PhoE
MAKALAKRLLVMRSGLTDWDAAGRVQGSTDLPICSAGHASVLEALEHAGKAELTAVITAPDEASRETARVVADRLGGKIVVVQELSEMALGLWEGMRYEDLERRFCRAGRLFLEDPCGVTAPEGEALDEYSVRFMKALRKAVGKCRLGTSAAVVLRPIGLGVARCALNDVDLGQLWSMVTERPPAEWYEVQRHDPRLKAAPARFRARAEAA